MPQISLHSPIGDISVSEFDGVIVALDWGWGSDQQVSSILKQAKDQLNAYFDGSLTSFDLPLAPHGTPFQQAVWAAMMEIPYGKTVTYGSMAKDLKSHARAIGAACGRNPIPIIIPCHRVLGSNGALHGYSGEGGIDTKAHLLRLEGYDLPLRQTSLF